MGMKFFLVLAGVMALNSCNTLIGIGRDTKQAFEWTKGKMQGTQSGGNNSGAPVY